jgi:hypothetical protein
MSNTAGSVWEHGGTRCEILDLEDPASHWASTPEDEGPECNRWLVICPHGCLASTPHYDMARWLAGHPAEFCEQHSSR